MSEEEDWHGRPGGPRRHHREGTPTCEACLRARRRADKYRRATGRRKHVPSGPVWKHILALREAKMGYPQIARAVGRAEVSIWRIQHQEKVHVNTARAILAIPIPKSPEELPDSVYVPMAGAQRRLLALQWQRWGLRHLAEHTYLHSDTLWRIRVGKGSTITVETHEEVKRLYEFIGLRRGPSRKGGGIPAAAWDDIDDPNEEPKGLEESRTA